MDKLKSILIKGFSVNAGRIRITASEAIECSNSSGPVPVDPMQPLSDRDLLELFQFLFPNDLTSLKEGKICKGALNIPGKGKVLLIAQPGPPPCLRLYLPEEGPQLFESDWVKLNSQTVAPAPPVGDFQAPPAMQAQPTAAPPPDNGMGFVPPDLSAPPDMAAPPAQQSAPGDMNADPFTVAPAGLPDIGSPPDAAMGMDPGMPDIGGGLEPPPMDALDMGSPGAGDMGFPPMDAMGAQPPPAASAPPPAMSAPPAMAAPHAQAAQQPAGPGPLPKIVFTSELPGETIVSDGQNPIDQIFKMMIESGASDLHMTLGEKICMRIDGDIRRIGDQILDANLMEQMLMPTMPDANQREFHEIHDTDYAYELRNVGRFRVNIFRDRLGVGAVMRHIPSQILTAEQLNLPQSILQFCKLTKGLVVVTGPTGSGKSTTLAAMVDQINKTRPDHILTIEDPVEFVHPQQMCLVNQREVGRHTKSFSRALKAALREDPDIVLIGEMRDLETIAIAIETAETGHLVFGTLHTTTAIGTVDRIIDQFPPDQQEQVRMMLASSLKGVVAQTLCRKIGGGRIAAHEILISDDAVAAMVREGKNHMIANHMQSQKRAGNQLLNECLVNYVKQGLVEPMEAFTKCVDKKQLVEMMRRNNINFDPSGSGEQIAS